MQRTKPNNKVFLRQNDDNLPVSIVVETNMNYCSSIDDLNSVVMFDLPVQVGSKVDIAF